MKHFSSKRNFLLISTILLAIIIRVYFLGHIPPSLYSDEVDQGYNAYSIMLTGRDEHGIFMPTSLRSFGDWKPPLPTYLMIPFIYFFGLNETAIRLPSVILGICTIILTYFLVKRIFYSNKIALLSVLFLSISPWHVLQSRSAMLVMVALFFFEMGVFFFIEAIQKLRYFIFSSISFVLSIYSYYGMRVITPLMLLFLVIVYRKKLFFFNKWTISAFIIGLLMLMPLISAFFVKPDVVFGRAKTISIFYDQGVKLRQWELITQDGINSPPLISRFFHNNIYLYGRSILQRFLSHFDGRYLFLIGDKSPPFQIPNMGLLYLVDAIFILIGLISILKDKYSNIYIFIIWIFLSLIPAALTFMTPSSNRTFNAVIPYAVICAVGLAIISKSKYLRVTIAGLITCIYIISFGYFLRQYFYNLEIKHADYWNYGWKEVVSYVTPVNNKYEQIIVSDTGMPYIYFLFYNKYDPVKFQKEAIRTYVPDQFGFEHVEGFDKYFFKTSLNWVDTKINFQRKTLYVIPYNDSMNDNDYIKAIYYPDGKIAYKIFAYE